MKTASIRQSSLRVLTTAIAAITATASADQTVLNVGDIAFVQANSDAPDTIGFVVLVDIAAGTYLHITDNARTTLDATSADWRFTTGELTEGLFTWIAPANITAGTVISFDTTSATYGIDLANGGDNLLAFQGTIRKPSFVGAVGWSSATPWISTGTPTANNSYLPQSLTLGATASQLGNLDNVSYSAALGGSSGTALALATAINTPANWTSSDTVIQIAPASFTVTGAVSGATATQQLFGYSFGFNAATYTNNPTLNLSGATASPFSYSGSGAFDIDGVGGNFSIQGARVAGGHSTSASVDLGTGPYFAFSLSIPGSNTFDLTHIELASQTDANGPTKLGLFASNDGFQTSFQLGSTVDLVSGSSVGLTFDDVSPAIFAGALDFRIYGWAAGGTAAGNWDVDEVWVNGVVAVPEPGSAALLLGGMGSLIAARRRRRS